MDLQRLTPDLGRIYCGDALAIMREWPENFVDTIITDPPYGIGFMGKAWDSFDPAFVHAKTKSYREGRDVDSDNGKKNRFASAAQKGGEYDRSVEANRKFQDWCCAWATEALRIAKPGAMMLVCGGPRTFHRMTAGLEDAGWQIRDCLMWLYGSGFPKSLDISKAIDKAKGAKRVKVRTPISPRSTAGKGTSNEIDERPWLTKARKLGYNESDGNDPVTDAAKAFNGWGTALKPAWEPIIVAMKPCDGTFAQNAEKWGVAGLNVDGGRIASCAESFTDNRPDKVQQNAYGKYGTADYDGSKGRWPANLILDEEVAGMLDGVSGVSSSNVRIAEDIDKPGATFALGRSGITPRGMSDSGGASRFFYVAKSCRAERNEGCDDFPAVRVDDGRKTDHHVPNLRTTPKQNHHPTVKPLELMKYLCMLTKTPTGGIVLDPFAGSGTTLWAAEFHSRPWIGIEMNPEYVAIANARIKNERDQLKMNL